MSKSFTSGDVASYLADMAQQLSELATDNGLTACAALLEAAQREAEWHSKNDMKQSLITRGC